MGIIDPTKTLFENERASIKGSIAEIQKLNEVNELLQQNGWLFLHPYSQGMDINYIEDICKNSSNPQHDIELHFGKKFFQLQATIHVIDGMHKVRPYIKEYSTSIEESVILCLQKDFRGAISILLPVIEGVLRKYLIDKDGEKNTSIVEIKKLLNALERLCNDYVDLRKQYPYSEITSKVSTTNSLNNNQEKELLRLHRVYIRLWTKQIRMFLENNLYRDTRDLKDNGVFNRHAIFHALDDTIDFTFANYLKLFHTLGYLSWLIAITKPGQSILSALHTDIVITKQTKYMKLIAVAEGVENLKAELLNRKPFSFKPYLSNDYIDDINLSINRVEASFSEIDMLKKRAEMAKYITSLKSEKDLAKFRTRFIMMAIWHKLFKRVSLLKFKLFRSR